MRFFPSCSDCCGEGQSWQLIVAYPEIDAFFRKTGKVIVALTVNDILEEHLAKKLG